MRRKVLRRAMAAVSGAIVTALVYLAAGECLMWLAQANRRAPEAYLGWLFLVVMPLGVAAGGLVAGWLCRADRSGLVLAGLVSPGTYLAVWLLLLSRGISKEHALGLVQLHWIGALLVFVASLAAVKLGIRVRVTRAERAALVGGERIDGSEP